MEPTRDQGGGGGRVKRSAGWLGALLVSRVPVLGWLPRYQLRRDLLADVSAGLTVACINVPQGLAFGLLAGVEPIQGLYAAVFPAFVYCLLGTAPVSSFGPVAVTSMLTGDAVAACGPSHPCSNLSASQVAVLVSFLVGSYYLALFLLRLAPLAGIFIRPFASGLMFGCSLHILAKSLPMLLGVSTAALPHGLFILPRLLYFLAAHLPDSHLPTLVLSAALLLVFLANELLIKPQVRKVTQVVVPMEAVVLGGSILVSYLGGLGELGVRVVGPVPSGLPTPALPPLEGVEWVWAAAVGVALLNYSTTTSMTLMFNERMVPSQELLAMGLANLVGSLFSCIPIGNSMTRTVIVSSLGIRTLLSSLVSVLVLLLVISFGGGLFEPLPRAALGAIVFVASLKLLLVRAQDFLPILREDHENGFIWGLTATVTICVSLNYGMLAGAVFSLRKILAQSPLAAVPKGPRDDPQLPTTTAETQELVGPAPRPR